MDDRQVHAGQAVYNPLVLRMYDIGVLGVSCTLLWRCRKGRILDLYNRNVAAKHVDVGVGTGYFLDECRFPVAKPSIALVDLNANSLAYTARRIARYDVTTRRANVLEPLDLPEPPYGSAGMNFLLHCVPGDIPSKAAALSNVAACVKPGGVVFGSTIVTEGVRISPPARAMIGLYNRRGIFHNHQDTLGDLERELSQRFDRHTVRIRGCVALFEATVG